MNRYSISQCSLKLCSVINWICQWQGCLEKWICLKMALDFPSPVALNVYTNVCLGKGFFMTEVEDWKIKWFHLNLLHSWVCNNKRQRLQINWRGKQNEEKIKINNLGAARPALWLYLCYTAQTDTAPILSWALLPQTIKLIVTPFILMDTQRFHNHRRTVHKPTPFLECRDMEKRRILDGNARRNTVMKNRL